jgi:hypothetical protein
MPLITGVDMTESNSRTKEISSRTVNGVAGLNIIASEVSLSAQLCRIQVILDIALAVNGTAPVERKIQRKEASGH